MLKKKNNVGVKVLAKRELILIITIASFNNDDVLINGVTKKILDQGKSFENLGFEVKFTGIINDQLYLFNNINSDPIAKITGKAYKDRRILYRNIVKMINVKNAPQYVYIRHVGSDFALLCMLKHLKICGTKTIIEFPTYPYFKEKLHNIKSIGGLMLDLFCNCFISKWITLSTNTNGYTKLFGTKSFAIENAVYIPRFKLHKKRINDGEIHLITVSSMAKWHGYDRVIRGLKTFKENSSNEYRVILHLVGTGPELPYYKELCDLYYLEDCVIFHGNMGGEKLDELFDKCDIGLSSFGLYRIGLKKVSTLKVREYCARGIPFAYAYNEQSLQENIEFACKFSNDDTPINIDIFIEFYKRLLQLNNITNEIRKFAINNFSFEKQFRDMFKNISEDNLE